MAKYAGPVEITGSDGATVRIRYAELETEGPSNWSGLLYLETARDGAAMGVIRSLLNGNADAWLSVPGTRRRAKIRFGESREKHDIGVRSELVVEVMNTLYSGDPVPFG